MINYLAGCSRDSRKIVASLLVIVLCFMAAIGSTYALFTSDGEIGVNTVSGYIDLDIIDTAQNSLLDETLQFIIHQGDGDVLFEPGATIHTQGFMIKNKGNITINYRIFISSDPAEDMEGFNDSFEILISEDPYNLSGALPMTEFVGKLGPQETTSTYYLVIKMKETATNEFQGRIYNGIGITVHAVQGNVDINDTTESDFE